MDHQRRREKQFLDTVAAKILLAHTQATNMLDAAKVDMVADTALGITVGNSAAKTLAVAATARTAGNLSMGAGRTTTATGADAYQ